MHNIQNAHKNNLQKQLLFFFFTIAFYKHMYVPILCPPQISNNQETYINFLISFNIYFLIKHLYFIIPH